MKSEQKLFNSINEYIAQFNPSVQERLESIRKTIQCAAPKATETISYGLPTFVQDGILVHFGAFQNHIGLYSLPSSLHVFDKELAAYTIGKGSVQFPFALPLPLDVISALVQMRVQENTEKRKAKKGKRNNE